MCDNMKNHRLNQIVYRFIATNKRLKTQGSDIARKSELLNMSRLISRIKSYLGQIKKDGFLFSVQRHACTSNNKRFGITVMVCTLTAYLVNLAIQESTDETEKNEVQRHNRYTTAKNIKGLDPKSIYNLEELVREEMYKNNQKPFLFARKVNLKLDWTNVEFIPSEIIYTQVFNCDNEDSRLIIFNTEFANETEMIQKHRIQSKRQIHYFREGFLTAGYSFGVDLGCLGLFLPVPKHLAKTGIVFKKEFMIKNPEGNSEEKVDTWEIEDSIKIPGRSTVKVAVQTTEKTSNFEFETTMGLRGNVIGKFYNTKKKVLHTLTIPIEEIIEKIPEDNRTRYQNIDYINIKGIVKYTNDVKHEIIIN